MNAWIDRLLDMGLASDAACWKSPSTFVSGVRIWVCGGGRGCGLFGRGDGDGWCGISATRIDDNGNTRFGDGLYAWGNGNGNGCGFGDPRGNGGEHRC